MYYLCCHYLARVFILFDLFQATGSFPAGNICQKLFNYKNYFINPNIFYSFNNVMIDCSTCCFLFIYSMTFNLSNIYQLSNSLI